MPSTWNLHLMRFGRLASQNRQIERIAQLRSCGRWKFSTRWPNFEYWHWLIMSNDLLKMTSWDCQEGNRACIPKFPSNSIRKISSQIHPKNSIFTILGLPQLLKPFSEHKILNTATNIWDDNEHILNCCNEAHRKIYTSYLVLELLVF